MTQGKRIFLNVVATYGRSLYSLIIGLVCGRWLLASLGHVDYGLIGLVGGLTGFVAFFNHILASAVGRFYAVNVGAAKKQGNEVQGLEDCRRWFNTALSIHSIVPIILIIVGYPIGCWAVENFLAIPPDRVHACIWVWRFTCITCFIGMFNVPFQAMYTAKQEIAELTLYSVITTTLNAGFIYFMVSHPQVWITKYAAWTCFSAILPQLIITARALIKYPECHFNSRYLFNRARYVDLLKYVGARFWSDFSGMFAGQTRAILVNKYAGPQYNAAMGIGNLVAGQALSLSGSLSSAFWPAIANKAGEGNESEVSRLSFVTCRLSAILVFVFALPLLLEVKEVMVLWLVDPPDFAAEICAILLIRACFERMTDGHWMAILGLGRGIMRYSWAVGWAGISSVIVAWALFACGINMWSLCIGMLASMCIIIGVRLYYGRIFANLSSIYWLRKVFVPITGLAFFTLLIGSIPRFLMAASFLRVCVTTAACELAFLPLAWLWVMDKSEKRFIHERILSRLPFKRR